MWTIFCWLLFSIAVDHDVKGKVGATEDFTPDVILHAPFFFIGHLSDQYVFVQIYGEASLVSRELLSGEGPKQENASASTVRGLLFYSKENHS